MDKAEAIDKIRKLEALANDSGATLGEAENARSLADQMRKRYNVEGNVGQPFGEAWSESIYQDLSDWFKERGWEAPPSKFHKAHRHYQPPPKPSDDVKASWSDSKTRAAWHDAYMRFNEQRKKPRYAHLDKNIFQTLFNLAVASQKKTEPFRPGDAYDWAWEQALKQADELLIYSNKAYRGLDGELVIVELLNATEKYREQLKYTNQAIRQVRASRHYIDRNSATAKRLMALGVDLDRIDEALRY